MRPEDFRPDDLFAQIQALVDGLRAERQAREAAEASDKAKSELLAMVSHELRTPMGAIISMAELLMSSALDQTQRRYAATLQQSARSLLTVLNDILDYSKLEGGGFELEKAPFDLHDFVQGVAQGLQARAREKHLACAVDVGASAPRFIRGDAVRLRQILGNLLDNAVKFTSDGSVRLHVSAPEIEGKTMLRFDVTDTGVGLSRVQQERLFRPYAEADRAIAAQYGGSGLGLSIAQRLVQLMGGEIGCESVVGQGSLFWFAIPVERADGSLVSTKPTMQAEPARSLSGHVLVVEDNSVNRMLIGAYLDEFGLTHEVVQSGAEAVMAIAANGFDLVLMDAMMPGLDGVETARRIRNLHGPSAEVPIVALIANGAKDGGSAAEPAPGMDGYVSKPIRGRELYLALAPFLAPDEYRQDAAVGFGP